MPPRNRTLLVALLPAAVLASSALAMDHVVMRQGEKQVPIDGQVLVQAQDGGLMLQGRDGMLWNIEPKNLVAHTTDAVPFTAWTGDEVAARVLAELPKGFEVHRTAHYRIVHNTSHEYALWCGTLFERLYRGFNSYWSYKGFNLEEPPFPLVAIVFSQRAGYLDFAHAELGDAASSMIGYFSLRTNRMTMYDLTGVEAIARGHSRRGTPGEINQVLAQPDAEWTVATIVHEATHQIAFNCGLHRRFSDCPLWFSEGIAMYFEKPDLSNSKGWRTVGGVNRTRLQQFRQHLRQRSPDSLGTLIESDRRFRDPQQGLDAYAEAWSLTYFLMQKHLKQYLDYLRMLSAKSPLIFDSPAQRREQFTQAFGDIRKLDAEFVRYMLHLQ